jgi:hypothetical protein
MASFYDVLAVLQPPYGEHGVGKGIFEVQVPCFL